MDLNMTQKGADDGRAECRSAEENQQYREEARTGTSTQAADVVDSAEDLGLDTEPVEATYTKMSPRDWATLQWATLPATHMSQSLRTAILETPDLERLPAGLFSLYWRLIFEAGSLSPDALEQREGDHTGSHQAGPRTAAARSPYKLVYSKAFFLQKVPRRPPGLQSDHGLPFH